MRSGALHPDNYALERARQTERKAKYLPPPPAPSAVWEAREAARVKSTAATVESNRAYLDWLLQHDAPEDSEEALAVFADLCTQREEIWSNSVRGHERAQQRLAAVRFLAAYWGEAPLAPPPVVLADDDCA